MTRNRAKMVRKSLSDDTMRVIEGRKKPAPNVKATGPKIGITDIAAAGAKTLKRRKKS